jgi:hypothetical protein
MGKLRQKGLLEIKRLTEKPLTFLFLPSYLEFGWAMFKMPSLNGSIPIE